MVNEGMNTPTAKGGGQKERACARQSAHQPCAVGDSFRTPLSGPGSAQHDAPEPEKLEFRSATKIKEKRKIRQLSRTPYARPKLVGDCEAGGASASVGARRKLLEDEKQRLLGLPRGEVCGRRTGAARRPGLCSARFSTRARFAARRLCVHTLSPER
jgi:hypothetical protein